MIVANISLISNSLVELKPFNAKLEWRDALDTSVFDILVLPFEYMNAFIENNSLPFHQPFYFKFYEAGWAVCKISWPIWAE